ncbi:hypothetical protein AN958_11523 [Leucoagaricus sp. SymC.cos]|nr:hypothetical protein AN958_11523 [Leucoagaricus sp. SymC.cos]
MLPALKILRVSRAIPMELERLCSLLIQFETTPKRPPESLQQGRQNSRPVPNTGSGQLTPGRPRFRIAPLLEELHITHLNDHPDFQDDNFKHYMFDDLQPLLLFANVRANNGMALKKLVIQGCHISVVISDFRLYFEEVVLVKRRKGHEYWEDSISEVWERGKVARPPHPDW